MKFTYYVYDDYTYVVSSYSGSSSVITFPDDLNISILADDLFKGHTEITEVILPDKLTNIGGFVFDGCINLRHIDLPVTLQNMWQYAFTRCGIENITIPENVRSIVPFTFNKCIFLKKAVLGPSVVNINAWAFKDCIQLSDVFVPRGCRISDKAFEGCGKISIHLLNEK